MGAVFTASIAYIWQPYLSAQSPFSICMFVSNSTPIDSTSTGAFICRGIKPEYISPGKHYSFSFASAATVTATATAAARGQVQAVTQAATRILYVLCGEVCTSPLV